MITSTTVRVQHSCNGVTTEFAIPFKFFANEDIKLTRYDVATDTPVLVTEGAYSIVGAGEEEGGTLTYLIDDAPVSSAYYLVISREVGFTQELDIKREQAFLPDALETQLDRIVMQIQQLRQIVLDAVGADTINELYEIISENTVVVDSIEELRALNTAFDGTDIYLRGYYAGSRKGAGRFIIDEDDVSSADDDGSVIVIADGRRAKRTDILGGFLEADFGVRADYTVDDQPQLQKAIDWLCACPAGEQRNLFGSPGKRKLLNTVTGLVNNKAYVTWTAPVGRQAIYSIETTDPGIELLRQGARARVYLNGICSIPGIAGAGTLLRVKGDGSFGVGSVPFPTAKITNCSCNPESDELSDAYSINPFDIERNSRPVFRDNEYRPGKFAERILGDYLLNVSNCYAFEVHNNTLGGFAENGMQCIHTINVEGGALSGNRTTQCNTGFKWQSATAQPGLHIGHNHFNSNKINYDIDGVKLMQLVGGLLFANNGPEYSYTRVGNVLTCVADGAQSTHDLVSPFQVRVWFDPEYVDPEYDGDNDGTADPTPGGIYTATVIDDSTFTIEDPLFGGLDETGILRMRWSNSTFQDIRLRNAVNCTISDVQFGGQAARNRYHMYLSTAGSTFETPRVEGIKVKDLRLTARSVLSPIYVGAGIKTVELHQAGIWAEALGTVSYPSTQLVEYEDTSSEVVHYIDTADTFEERSAGGFINTIKNSKFKRGNLFWDTGAGWSVSTSETGALSERAYAIYVAPDTSNNNLLSKASIPCEVGTPLVVEWTYRVTTGTLTQNRVRVNFYDIDGVAVGSTLFSSTDLTQPADWYHKNASFTVPDTATAAIVGIQVAGSVGTTMHVDRLTTVQPTSVALAEGNRQGVVISDGGATVWPVSSIYAFDAVGDGSDETTVIEAAEASAASIIDLHGLHIYTTLDPKTLVKKYYNGRVYGEDADGNIQVYPNHSLFYDSEILKSSTQTPFLDWENATILSLGTSIQAEGSGSNDSYPELAAEMLGANCVNFAWAGTSAAYDNTGDHTEIGTVKRLSMTQDDVDWGIATWGDVDTNVYSDLYPGINKASKMTMDYRVVAQMAAYSPDVILIEHNRNDMDRSPGVLENESRAISSVSLGATTTLTLASGGLVIVGDAVRLRVTGISKLDYYVARVQAVSGAQITLNLDSSGFAGSFVSGTCYKVDRQYFCEALGAIISQIYWASTYYGVTTPAIVLTSAPSEYDSDSYDYRVRSNAQYVKDVADYWDVGFFDLNASLAIDANNHTVFLGDTIHPVDLVSRQAIANHLAAYLAGGKLPSLRKAQVLLRAQTDDFNDGASVVYDAWDEGFKERDWKVGTISTAHTDDFSSGLGGYTLTGTAPTTGASPWDGGNTALSCTHDGISGTSYIQKTGLTLGEYTKVSFKIYLDSTVGLTSAGTTGTLPIMHLRTGSVHHAIQLIIKETAVSMRGYVIPAGASPATVVPRSKVLSDATVHEITYEVIKGNGTTRQGSCILTLDGERISLPLEFDDSSKSVPDRVFLGIISNTGDMPIEVWFDDLTIETGAVVTTTVSDFSRTVLDDTSASAWRSTLGLVIGTDVQPYNANTFIMETLSAARTYYVRSDGSDANDGLSDTAGGAFLTVNKAVETALALNFNRQTVTIQSRLAICTEAINIAGPVASGGTLTLRGDTTTPANCTLAPTSGIAISVTRVVSGLNVEGFKITSPDNHGLFANQGSNVTISGACEFGACFLSHISSQVGSYVQRNANITVTGAAARHVRCALGGSYEGIAGTTVTISGTPAFSTAFVEMNRGSSYYEGNATAYSGAATGFKFMVDSDCSLRGNTSIVDFNSILLGDKLGVIRPIQTTPLQPMRNIVINGDGLLQNGPSGAVGDDVYGLHDRWYVLSQSGNVTPSTISDVANGIPQMIRLTNSHGSAQRVGYAQIVSSDVARRFRGKRLAISFKAKCSEASKTVRCSLLSWSGTADTLTSDVVNSWTNTTYTVGNFFTNPAGLSVLFSNGGTLTAADTLYDMHSSLFLADVPSDCNNLVVFMHSTATLSASATLDFRTQIEEGAQASPFDLRAPHVERLLARRRIQRKTVNSINGTIFVPLDEMVATPTLTIVSGAGSVANATKDGFHLTHTSVASHDILCTAEL